MKTYKGAINLQSGILFLVFCAILSASSCNPKIDYARFENKNDWSQHYAYGSPSWDCFERFANNPVYRGYKGMEWPVNGFLFADPASQDWFLYIGEYTKNYSNSDPFYKDRNCLIYKSSDKGKTWKNLGNLFPDGMVCYDSIEVRIPDVMVTYAEQKYHLVFDWRSKYANWMDMRNGGIGYAVSDKPEGPFVVSKEPLTFNTRNLQKPLLNRYWRTYAPMIFKRENDWSIAYMMDGVPAWALAVSTASKPEGPYSAPKIVLNVERKTNYQPLQEFFPAFTHEGYAYFPSTSVAINRNYQSIHRVKIEDMTDPEKYELFCAGSLWHSVNVENEYSGIWGQTFSGFIDNKDTLYIMYPSKDRKDFGTINLAKSSWKNLNRNRGFWVTAQEGKSISYLKKIINMDGIDISFALEGVMHIVWDFNTPLDVQNIWGKFSFDGSDAEYKEISISKTKWLVSYYSKIKGKINLDSGKIQTWKDDGNTLNIKNTNGQFELFINEEKCWKGKMTESPGLIGIMLNKHSYLFVDRFEVKGKQLKGQVTYGFFDALVASGNKEKDWEFKQGSAFLLGRGAVSKRDSSFAKWNFDGEGVELYLPKGPHYNNVNIYLDGVLAGRVSLNSEKEQKSFLVYKSGILKMQPHAVYIESMDGLLPVDCIKVNM
ncbi:MAG: hypothetical protein M0Q53_02670 [Prolixibacteraceae bacterium]|jgi:hypothetical protein|nr:hypothetical protein [Prolixibacteraceae bacterium]